LKGRSGISEEDVLVISKVPASLLTMVLDAKSRGHGKLTDMNLLTVRDYQKQAEATQAVVVAGDFSDGKIVRQAKEQGIALCTVDLLCDLLRIHARTPLCLSDFEVVFATPGVVDSMPEGVLQAVEQQLRWAELLALLLSSLETTYKDGFEEPLNADQISILLFSRQTKKNRFRAEEIRAALDLLCSPLLGCLEKDSNGAFVLRMTQATFTRRLRSLTDHTESYSSGLVEGKEGKDSLDE